MTMTALVRLGASCVSEVRTATIPVKSVVSTVVCFSFSRRSTFATHLHFGRGSRAVVMSFPHFPLACTASFRIASLVLFFCMSRAACSVRALAHQVACSEARPSFDREYQRLRRWLQAGPRASSMVHEVCSREGQWT